MQATLQYGTCRFAVNTNLSMEQVMRNYRNHYKAQLKDEAKGGGIPMAECKCPERGNNA